jgi:pimeloyl-CoA synthetase
VLNTRLGAGNKQLAVRELEKNAPILGCFDETSELRCNRGAVLMSIGTHSRLLQATKLKGVRKVEFERPRGKTQIPDTCATRADRTNK